MKTFIVSGLSSLIFGSFISSVFASELAMTSNSQTANQPFLGAVTLVGLANQGFLADQGIPSHLALGFAVKSGKIDGYTLVKAAIESGRLSPDTINNATYLSQVQLELSQLDKS